jgi:hypothetical protein
MPCYHPIDSHVVDYLPREHASEEEFARNEIAAEADARRL